jgi:Spy/CpxP family protein refolding chaperone
MTKAIVLATAIAVTSLATPAAAVTCDDVRALSPSQREYWAKRLGITPEQRQQIKLECFGGGRKSLRRHQQASQ